MQKRRSGPPCKRRFLPAFLAWTMAMHVAHASLQKDAPPPSAPHADTLLQQAKTLVKSTDYAAADAVLRRYLTEAPGSAEALYLLAFVQQRENQPKASLQTYTEAAGIQPPTAENLRLVALDYVLLDSYADALRWLNKAVQMDPHNAEAWYDLGRANMHEGRFQEASEHLRTSLKLKPDSSRALDNLGICLEALNRSDEAAAAYAEAVKAADRDPHPSEQPYLDYGTLLNTRNGFAEAVPLLTRAVKLAPSCARTFAELARSFLGLKDTASAQKTMERAVELDGKNSRLHFQLGRIYKQTGQETLAAREFRLSAELYGGHSAE